MTLIDQFNPTPAERRILELECLRRAAFHFHQAGLLQDAAECWVEAGQPAKAAELYLQMDDPAQAAPLLLEAGRYEEALNAYQSWLAGQAADDLLNWVGATLGLAACLTRQAKAAPERPEQEHLMEEAGRYYLAARSRIEAQAGAGDLLAARCWEALGAYGVTVDRPDLVQIGYEQALLGYGPRHNGERLRAGRAYLAASAENRLLAADLARRLAEWEPLPGRREWEQWREEIEGSGFREGVRDVLHFADEERQLAAWHKLAAIENDPDQAQIDDYLRSLAPAALVYIPAGPFLMGSPDDDPDARDNEKPQHEVWLPGYYIGRYPVTNEEYQAFIEVGGYAEEGYWAEAIAAGRWENGQYRDYAGRMQDRPEYWGRAGYNNPRQPVVTVSWYEAVAYCRRLGARLPTEAEWEKAAGWDAAAGRKRRYPWGDELDQEKYVYDYGNWPEVGQISPGAENAYGVADMAGLYTWCSTRWTGFSYPYDAADGREEMSGGDDIIRVLRGGGSSPERARCAFRYGLYPWFGNYLGGIRVLAPRRLPSYSES